MIGSIADVRRAACAGPGREKLAAREGVSLMPDVHHYRFYEKVIKVKDDVAAFLIFISQMFSLPH